LLARGLAADGTINNAEVEFLQKWLAANAEISNHPIIRTMQPSPIGTPRS
jgi:hypothetical protein